jgi:hypothetical protein
MVVANRSKLPIRRFASLTLVVSLVGYAKLFLGLEKYRFFWAPTVNDVAVVHVATSTIEGDAAPQTLADCFPYVSSTWVEARHHNIDDGGSDGGSIVTEKSGDSDYLTQVLSQTLCHEDSTFVNPPEHLKHSSSDKQLELEEEHHWLFRLAYLGYHLHQHEPAFKEMEERRQKQEGHEQCRPTDSFTSDGLNSNSSAKSSGQRYPAPAYEYECPNKYQVFGF